ncbi:MAG: SCO family protein [Gammaproteobacteria bacterium]|jgi:cytochrome oxidase Cu insertion factor (SCO1/SenC/PrrC family)
MKALQRISGIGIALIALLGTPSLHAQDSQIDRARDYFTNLELVDQDGNTVRFFDDVLKDNVVVIDFIFTNCEGACPLMTQKLTVVRDQLIGRFDNPVKFVSLSIDPLRDTPAALKAFADKHGADHDGWTWLTGDPRHLQEIIRRLGQYTDDIESHSTMMLAGNVNEAHWMKILPQELPAQITSKIKLLLGESGI